MTALMSDSGVKCFQSASGAFEGGATFLEYRAINFEILTIHILQRRTTGEFGIDTSPAMSQIPV